MGLEQEVTGDDADEFNRDVSDYSLTTPLIKGKHKLGQLPFASPADSKFRDSSSGAGTTNQKNLKVTQLTNSSYTLGEEPIKHSDTVRSLKEKLEFRR